MIVVTGCDEGYLPGVLALNNSIKQNVPEGEIDLWCLVYGDTELEKKIQARGIKTILNPSFPEGTHLPCGGWWTEKAMPAMYCRLLIPSLFPNEERVLWLDADIILVDSINEMSTRDLRGHPVAGWPCQKIGQKFSPPRNDSRQGFATGILIIDIPKWNELDITSKCIDIMNSLSVEEAKTMNGVVENVLNLAIPENFEPLENKYHINPKRKTQIPENTKILHFACLEPWNLEQLKRKPASFTVAVNKWWDPYEDKD